MDQRESSFPFLLIQVTKKVLMQLFLRRLKKHFGLVNFSFLSEWNRQLNLNSLQTMSSFASKTPAFTDKLHSHYSTKDECFLHHRFECNIELSFCYRNFVPNTSKSGKITRSWNCKFRLKSCIQLLTIFPKDRMLLKLCRIRAPFCSFSSRNKLKTENALKYI